jgi:hypothetical protein
MRLTQLFLLAVLLTFAPTVFSKGSGGNGGGHSGSASRSSARSNKCVSCARDSKGKIARNPAAVREFKKTHPCPGSCKGMVVDHIVPLKRGGADSPSNMQWQTKAEAKAKDKIE